MLVKGILSFPTLFTPKVAKGATDAKFGASVLIAPNDPQIAVIQAEVDQAKANGFPSGYTGQDECFGPYDVKYAGKDYYDPRFAGWYVFSCSAKAEDRPAVVDMNYTQIIDPAAVYSGMVGYINAGISAYIKGKGGIGGWLNGVMITAEDPPMGRLDGKPTVDQMFVGVNGGTVAPAAAAPGVALPAPNAVPAPATPPPSVPAPAPQLVMTAKANGATYDAMIAAGWTDDMMIQQGMVIAPSFT